MAVLPFFSVNSVSFTCLYDCSISLPSYKTESLCQCFYSRDVDAVPHMDKDMTPFKPVSAMAPSKSSAARGHGCAHRGRSPGTAGLLRQLLSPVLRVIPFPDQLCARPCSCRCAWCHLMCGSFLGRVSIAEDCTALSLIPLSTWTKCRTEPQRQEPVLCYFIV